MKINTSVVMSILCLIMVVCLFKMLPGLHLDFGDGKNREYSYDESVFEASVTTTREFRETRQFGLAKSGFYISAFVLTGIFLVKINRKQSQTS